MHNRNCTALFVALTVLLICSTTAAQTRYNYGKSTHGREGGFIVSVEAGPANPRNTDNIVAASGPNVVIPQWDDEFAGRLGFGYQWSNGNKLMLSVWNLSAEQSAAGDSSPAAFFFPIGPAIGSSFNVTTEVSGLTTDVAWGVTHEPTDAFSLEWSVGLRYASFEETTDGRYGTLDVTRTVDKSLQGDMLGAKLAGRGTYRMGSFSASVGMGLSALDGELEARASLTPQPQDTIAVRLIDDSRSGTILDFDLNAAWHSPDDSFSIWLGWEQQVWEDIAADLTRNLPDSNVPSRERDSVTFSWFKVGVSYRF